MSDFNKRSAASDGLRSDCRECHRAEKVRYRVDVPLPRLIAKARVRAEQKGLDFDLHRHRAQLQRRLETGLCEVTGVALQVAGGIDNPYVPSIDRIDPKRGYTYDNVRIVCYGINAAMNVWGIGPIERMMAHRRRLIEEMLS